MVMFELQNSMNSKVHEQWRSQGFEWYRAIWVECAELMDHYGWKWWKKQTPAKEQVVLELIDIWHFGLSSLLEASSDINALAQTVSEQLSKPATSGDFLSDVEAFSAKVLTTKAFDVEGFARLMHAMGLSFEDLYRNYVGKNVLNVFRQDNGYKTGEYRKQWAGREDNEHLVEVLDVLDISSTSFKSDIYAQLETRYTQGRGVKAEPA